MDECFSSNLVLDGGKRLAPLRVRDAKEQRVLERNLFESKVLLAALSLDAVDPAEGAGPARAGT